MGACLSSANDSSTNASSSALVISPKGQLHPYPTPVFVSDVLQLHSSSFFLCNSDNLSYDHRITPLHPQHQLDAGQIYFLLPLSKLRHPLTASDMAALAVKASLALNANTNANANANANAKAISPPTSSSTSKSKRNNKSKISPFVVMESSNIKVIVDEDAQKFDTAHKQQTSSLGVSRSGSIRKMQRYSSRKARLAVRSFRLRLSTIYESETSDQSHKQY